MFIILFFFCIFFKNILKIKINKLTIIIYDFLPSLGQLDNFISVLWFIGDELSRIIFSSSSVGQIFTIKKFL